METRVYTMADALEGIFTRAALDATHVKLGAAGDNLANFFKVCKYWKDVACSDGVWKEITPKIWGAGASDADGKLHHTYYQRFSKFTMMHEKKSFEFENLSALAVSNTHLVLGSNYGFLYSLTLPDLQWANIYETPRDKRSYRTYGVVGIILNEENIIVGCRYGSVLRGRLGSNAIDVLDSVSDCGEMKHFSGTKYYFVGLFMGVQNKSFCVWRFQNNNIIIVYKGGDFCHGVGHIVNNQTYARIGVAGNIVVACSVRALIGFDITQPSIIRNEVVFHPPEAYNIVSSPDVKIPMLNTFSVGADSFLLVDRRDHIATIRRAADFTVVCKFPTYRQGVIGFLNKYVAFMYCPYGGRTTAWDAVTGKRLREMRKRIKGATHMIASDRYLVALTITCEIHVWDASRRGIDLGSDDEDE